MTREVGTGTYLSDIYTFGEWLRTNYIGAKREPLLIEPVQDGLIRIREMPRDVRAMAHEPIVPCRKCGVPCSGSFSDSMSQEKLCINCWYALKCENKNNDIRELH